MRWTDISSDPNSRDVLDARRRVVQSAAARDPRSRLSLIEEHCRGLEVLDVGCVAHERTRIAAHEWLHGRIAAVARRVVGIDVLPEGIAAMRALGYEVLCADATGDVRPVAALGPFDVVVAGEIIEHLGSPEALLRNAYTLLKPGGHVIVTTPNPYAATRYRNGQLNRVWENADHVAYLFPGGMVELAERTGLELVRFSAPMQISPRRLILRSVKWTLLDGVARLRNRPTGIGAISIVDALPSLTSRRWFMGESATYVLTKPARPSDHPLPS